MTSLFKKKYLRTPQISFFNAIKEVGRNPFVDWIWVLIVSLVLAIIFIINAFSLYKAVTSGDIREADVTTTQPQQIFNSKDLSSIINRFDAKEVKRNQAKERYAGPSDPSI